MEDLRQLQHRQRCELCGLDHHRAAGGDRGAHLAGAHRQWEVPRSDEQAGADGLAHRDQAAIAGRGRQPLPVMRTASSANHRKNSAP